MVFFFGVQDSFSNLELNFGYEKWPYTPDFTIFSTIKRKVFRPMGSFPLRAWNEAFNVSFVDLFALKI